LAIGVLFITLINGRRRFPSAKVVMATVLLLTLFNFVGVDRLAFRKIIVGDMTVSDFVEAYQEERAGMALTGDMQEYDVLSAILTVFPEKTGYTYGSQYLRLFIWPIPRFIWQDKPIYTSIVNLLDYGDFYWMTYTLYGDSYMTIGIFGMVAILFGISLYLNRLYIGVCNSPTPLRILVYLIHMMYATVIFRDGPVSAAYYIAILSGGAFVLCRSGSLKNVVLA